MRWLQSRCSRFINALSLTLAVLLTSAFAQLPKRVEEEEEKPKKMDKREEEEVGGGAVKKPLRIDDTKPPKEKPKSAALDIDLGRSAKQSKHPGVKQLFTDLSIPHDIVEVRNPISGDRRERVRPYPDFIVPSKLTGNLKLKTLDAEGKDGKEFQLSQSAIKEVVPYERVAQRAVEKFLSERWENFAAIEPRHLSVDDKLLAAEQALTAALRYHEAAREEKGRTGEGWDDIRAELRGRLLKVILERLQLIVEKESWDDALALAAETGKRFTTTEEHKAIAMPLAKLAETMLAKSLSDKKYRDTLNHLKQIEDRLPLSEATKPLRDRLVAAAQPIFDEAMSLKKKNLLKEAQAKLQQAEDICPFLPGLRDLRVDVAGDYPILKTGVRELPRYLSPALAFSDAEKQAVEMIFEGLYELGPEPDGGRYRPALARGRPGLVALGREIALPRDAFWSNGEPITSSDVSGTLRLLRHQQWPARIHSWADDLMDNAVITDPHQVKLTLRQGILDPLAVMSFKVLPEKLLRRPDDKDFGEKPIGSGPFYLDPSGQSEGGKPYTRFLSNPFYRNRPGRMGLPRIREVQFFPMTSDLGKDFAEGRLDFVPDVPLEQVAPLKKTANVTVAGPLPNRRIYMLAINHRRPNLDSAPLRRALALAIDRNKILKECFRPSLDDKTHSPLCGPYPSSSWASPSLRADEQNRADTLYNVNSAKLALQTAKKSNVRLELMYPDEDASLPKAMSQIKTALEGTLNIQIQLKKVPLRNLRDDVEGTHEYDLAYYWYDYPDSTYWLWPLLDPRSTQIGGRNFLGYNGAGGRLEEMCRKAMEHRDFQRVREITHTIHQVFVQQEMPFIPLWQLDRFVAHSNRLQMLDGTRPLNLSGPAPEIDPLRAFGTIEYWRLAGK